MTTDIHAATQAIREAFEAWWTKNRDGNPESLSRRGEGYYWRDADRAWNVWQAATQARDAEIAALESKLRATEATLFEYRKLINERPAVNAGLLSEYQRWTGKVYSLEIINAVDVAIDQARTDGRS